MPNYLDFLVALDEQIRQSSLGFIIYGHELYAIAQQAGLIAGGDLSPARWAGELVGDGYVSHGPLSLGDRRPLVPGHYTPDDVSRVSDWRVTATGREEADRIRRQLREALTDAAIGGTLPTLLAAPMSDAQRQAITVPFTHLRSALDDGHHSGAIGAAKDLVEAACKLTIVRSGALVPSAASLPSLFKDALGASGTADAGSDIGRSLAATVLRLAELRNAVGSGHGRAAQPDVSARDARMAASAACGIALFLLSPQG